VTTIDHSLCYLGDFWGERQVERKGRQRREVRASSIKHCSAGWGGFSRKACLKKGKRHRGGARQGEWLRRERESLKKGEEKRKASPTNKKGGAKTRGKKALEDREKNACTRKKNCLRKEAPPPPKGEGKIPGPQEEPPRAVPGPKGRVNHLFCQGEGKRGSARGKLSLSGRRSRRKENIPGQKKKKLRLRGKGLSFREEKSSLRVPQKGLQEGHTLKGTLSRKEKK